MAVVAQQKGLGDRLQKRTNNSIERFGLIGRLYGTASKDLAFSVERLQQDPKCFITVIRWLVS